MLLLETLRGGNETRFLVVLTCVDQSLLLCFDSGL
jgi:hypothetical protein